MKMSYNTLTKPIIEPLKAKKQSTTLWSLANSTILEVPICEICRFIFCRKNVFTFDIFSAIIYVVNSYMDNESIMICIELVCTALPQLRDCLNLTQDDFSKIIGTSRQSVINIEHRQKKITRSILISMISFFSLRSQTAEILRDKGLYSNSYVQGLGFSEDVLAKIYEWSS